MFHRFLPVFLLLLFFCQGFAQNISTYYPWQIDSLIIADTTISTFAFPQNHRVIDQSIRVHVNGRQLDYPLEYNYYPEKYIISFFTSIGKGDSLHISYQILPVLLQRSYSFFHLDTLSADTDTTDSISISKTFFENPFAGVGGNLKRSGSIVRGVNIGSNKDMTLNSGLNLQLSGNLTDDLEIVAALTDESTPIQPEGNTQTLREIDKVFIRFKSPWVSGVLGDFNLSYTGAQYGSFSRKLQGVSLTGHHNNFELGGSIASTRGFFNFVSFVGQEGNQGPYQLLGKNGEKEIIVLGGTERIWINGERLIRGENNDYVIEYSNGQITFTNKRLITSESRVEVDFEYYPAIQKYTRNVYSGLTSGGFFGKSLNYRISYYHEEDDPDKILEAEGNLTDEEIEAIKEAGDDPLKAAISGAYYVGDSTGNYVKIDTLINNMDYEYYRYVGDSLGNYIVTFTSVGPGNGDYIRQGLGIFVWVGISKGEYLPVELLPLPSKHQLLDIQAEYKPLEKFRINAEAAISRLDRNVISDIGDKDNQGKAYSLSAQLDQIPVSLSGSPLGSFAFIFNGKYIDKKFQPVDRINQPDFNRYWNLLPDTEKNNEEQSVELKSKYLPWEWITFTANIGSFKKSLFKSNRYNLGLNWRNDDWFSGDLNHEIIKSSQQQTKNDWLKQKGNLRKDIGHIQPAILFEHEARKNINGKEINGFEFYDYGGRLSLIKSSLVSGYLQYNRRTDDVFDPARGGEKIPQATSQTKRLRLDLAEWHQTSGYLEVVLRKKDYTSFFEELKIDSVKEQYLNYALQDTAWQDRQTNLIEFLLKNYQWNRAMDIQWQYRISIGLTALREKVYINVGEGHGNFRYDKTLGEYVPDPNGDFVLFIVPSGQFEPITNLGTSLRLLLEPQRIIKKPENTLEKILSDLSSDSYFRIEEESKDKNLNNLYFLKLSTFQGANTVSGSMIYNQDLYYMRRNRDLSFRFRYRYRDDLFNQFLDPIDNEDRLSVERSLWANYKIFEKFKAQSEIKNVTTFRENKANVSRNRDINSNIFIQNISFRPDQIWEFGIESEFGHEVDNAGNKDLRINYSRGLFRASYAFLGKGKISSSFDYLTVSVKNNPLGSSIPYEMARGKKEGVSKNWQLRGEYTIAQNVVVSLFYTGRDDADFEQVIHTGQAEIRAYF